MKAGTHAGEDLNAIIARKQRETGSVGWCLWGYGGAACHPVTQVQPHAAISVCPVTVLFLRTPSKPAMAPRSARDYSPDGHVWHRLPDGHIVTGSKWALVLTGLTQVCWEVDLGAYRAAIGPSAGTSIASYMRGRCDKACALAADTPGPHTPALVVATAELTTPYAVFLR